MLTEGRHQLRRLEQQQQPIDWVRYPKLVGESLGGFFNGRRRRPKLGTTVLLLVLGVLLGAVWFDIDFKLTVGVKARSGFLAETQQKAR
jgi:hypothetical protein